MVRHPVNNALEKAVFIDRDGTLIKEQEYLSDPEKVVLEKTAVEALRLLQGHKFKLIIATNQSGVGRKYFTEHRLRAVHRRLLDLLAVHLIRIDAIYYCPHHPDQRCSCRKPQSGMAHRAKKTFNLDLKQSFSVGDKLSDVEFGRNFGGKGVLVLTGYGKEEARKLSESERKPDHTAEDIYHAAQWIIAQQKEAH